MILFECPGMMGPLDTASLKRQPIIPFLGRERYDSWISEQKNLPVDRAPSPKNVERCIYKYIDRKNKDNFFLLTYSNH
jgi:hypothetical protein